MPKNRNLEMTNEEIVHCYGMAGETDNDKNQQIRVIAELNACKPADIVAVLEEEGVELPEKVRKVRKGRSRGVSTDTLNDALQDALEAPKPVVNTTEQTMPDPAADQVAHIAATLLTQGNETAPFYKSLEQPTYAISIKLAALDAILALLPTEDCTGGDALNFVLKVHGVFELVDEVTA